MNPIFWLLFPFLCVGLVFATVGVARLVRWLIHRLDWLDFVRTQRTAWEREEIELLRSGRDDAE